MIHHESLESLANPFPSFKGSKVFGALLSNSSKDFDCVSHDLLISRFNFYWLSLSGAKLVLNYLQNQKQRTKIGSSCSPGKETISGVFHKDLYWDLFGST